MVRAALVGLGDIGRNAHLPAMMRHPEVEVAALVDSVVDRAKSAAKDVGLSVPTFETMQPVLGEDIPAVVMATPPWVSPELAAQLLRAGRYVLVEKPVATTVAATAPYQGLTGPEQARLQVGLTYRHDPAIQLLRDWLHGGDLGRPLLVRAHIFDEPHHADTPDHTRRIVTTLEHGPPVVHEGSHIFDWLSFLFGAGPVSLDDAWALRTRDGLPSPNVVGARLTYPKDTTVLVEFGWLNDAQPRAEISLLGARGMALLDGHTFHLERTTAETHEAFDFPGERTERCFDLQLARFVELATGQRPNGEPSLQDGVAALQIAEDVAGAAGRREVVRS